jgi:hypothetical protein
MGTQFEIVHNGVPRTCRDRREIAIEAALFHKQRLPTEEVAVRHLRDGTVVRSYGTDGQASSILEGFRRQAKRQIETIATPP